MTPQFWINAAFRSAIWLGVAAGYAYFKKPDGASLLAVRTDAIGWLGGGVVLAGLALHFWSTAILARGERREDSQERGARNVWQPAHLQDELPDSLVLCQRVRSASPSCTAANARCASASAVQ